MLFKTIAAIGLCLGIALGSPSNENMKLLSKSSKSHLITVNDQNFEQILAGPRDFNLVLMLSASGSKVNCILCNEIKPEYELIAKSWYQDHPNGLSESDRETVDGEVKDLYFAYADFTDSRKLFLAYNLNSVPKVYFYGPTTNSNPKSFITEFDQYVFVPGVHSELLKNYLEKATGLKLNLYIPINYGRIVTNAATTFALALLIIKFWSQILVLLSSKFLWATCCIILVIFFNCGYMFNQIRKTAFVKPGRDGNVEYFVPGLQNQLGVETVIVSFIYGSLAFLTVSLFKTVPKIKNSRVQLLTTLLVSITILLTYSYLLIIFGSKGLGYPYRLLLA